MKTEPKQTLSNEDLPAANMLEASGVRATFARRQVLAVLLGSNRAMSHLDVQAALPAMDRVTLYRALDCLTDAGIAHKISGDDRVFRYNTGKEQPMHGHQANPQHAHGHFKCTRCSRVFCLDDDSHHNIMTKPWQTKLESSLETTLGAGFQSHEIELTIKGWCADCAQ
ncbi:Fur family transcriptional regulator [Undibacterium sp. Dicai25W]|uniref:Fur family transcriptional regulator n=1 Tax=Undibacterium sp. Dicai25W TaxID=3413034 RepID=UPI003BF34548